MADIESRRQLPAVAPRWPGALLHDGPVRWKDDGGRHQAEHVHVRSGNADGVIRFRLYQSVPCRSVSPVRGVTRWTAFPDPETVAEYGRRLDVAAGGRRPQLG